MDFIEGGNLAEYIQNINRSKNEQKLKNYNIIEQTYKVIIQQLLIAVE